MTESPDGLDASSPLLGTMIGKYKVVRILGQGGMGTVYEAVHEDIGQSAAIKVLRPVLSQEPKFAQRFFDEAKAVSKVQHPGLIKIFDFNRLPDGTLYLMMEFLRGELLWDRIVRLRKRPEGGAFEVKDAVRITRQLASALAAVHKAGIVHRDLKHENIFLVPDPDTQSGERAKILDFGIAKDADTEGRRTTTGVSIGTPGYMSPEQCDGVSVVTDRSDVYSLGIMFYEMLAGKPPFSAPSVTALMRQHMTKQVPPLPANVPATVSALVLQMLAKEPEPRPSMQQVLERLDQLSPRITGATPVTAVAGPVISVSHTDLAKRLWWAGTGLFAAMLLASVLWLSIHRQVPPPQLKPIPELAVDLGTPLPKSVPVPATPPIPPKTDAKEKPTTPASDGGSSGKSAKSGKKGKSGGKKGKQPAGFWSDPTTSSGRNKKHGS